MFTRKDFCQSMKELRHIEEKMSKHYSDVVDTLDDEQLRLRFTSLAQCEQQHAQALDTLIEIGNRGSELQVPELKWTVARKTGGLILLLLGWMAIILLYSHFTQIRIIRQFHDVAKIQIPLIDYLREYEKSQILFLQDTEKVFSQEASPSGNFSFRSGAESTPASSSVNLIQAALQLSIETNLDSPERRKKYALMTSAITKLLEQHKQFDANITEIKRLRKERMSVPDSLMNSLQPEALLVQQRTRELILEAKRFTDESMSIIIQERASFIRNSSLMILGGIFLGLFLAWIVIRGLRKTFGDMSEHTKAITQAILQDKIPEATISVKTTDEASVLAYLWNTMLTALASNLRRRKKLEQEIELTTTTDRLTGIINRRSFEDRLNVEVSRSQRYSTGLTILIADIDHFSKINDDFGGETGDIVISEIAQTIKDCVRDCDIVSRYGGGEFAIIATNTDISGAAALAEKIRRSIHEAQSIPISGVTMSIGIAQWQTGQTIRELVRSALNALASAKKNGRDIVEIGEQKRS